MGLLSASLGESVSIFQLSISFLIVATGILAAVFLNWLMKWLAQRSKESQFRFDGIVIRVAAKPVAILIGTLSFLLAFRRLEAVNQYLNQWEQLETALVIVIVAWMIGSLVRELIDSYLEPYVNSTNSDFDERLLYLMDLTSSYVIYILGIAIALHTIGVEISALIASLGIAGLAVALATKTILSNFFGGIILTMDRYIQPGHRVRIGDWLGDVEEITLYKTTIRTRGNLLVSIPNDVLMNETTINYNLPESLTRIEVCVGVAYETDLKYVTGIIQDEISQMDDISERRDPEVNVKSLGDNAITLSILIWQEEPTAQRLTRDTIFRRIIKRFRIEDIEIPFPQRNVSIEENSIS